jgi:hypothetical protein
MEYFYYYPFAQKRFLNFYFGDVIKPDSEIVFCDYSFVGPPFGIFPVPVAAS